MKKNRVFVIMPFQDEFLEVYEMLKSKLHDRFEFTNAGDEGNQQNILKDIVQPIYEADIVIADLTGLNANVMYELGLAHSFNKKTIIITKDDLSKLPFDLKQYRAKDYDTHFIKFDELLNYLDTNLTGAANNTVLFGNPVKDFLKLENINDIPWFNDKTAIDIDGDTDMGFIDFLDSIESSADDFQISITEISKDMEIMSEGISKSTSEIERVKISGGNGTASFIRKEIKKAARYVEDFSSSLKIHNKNLPVLWNEIEKNTFGLLENKFSNSTENKRMLIDYLKSLYETKTSITVSNQSVADLKSSMESVTGIEKSLTKAIQFVTSDLTTYLNNTEYFKTSITRILDKSKFIVGDIDFE